ncbi:hypothetical protein FQA39_LY09140 [Lamprigera yunnana]|nr:hypothetical protein FQA39_LY09140 [Lamprigera yunnana]
MRLYTFFVCVVIIITVDYSFADENVDLSEECLTLYQEGVQAYLENNFEGCVTKLEEGLKYYSTFTKALKNCRLKCKQDAELADPLYSVDVEDMHYYEKTIRNTLCLIKCRKSQPGLALSSSLRPETEKIYEERKPYEYIHLCYYQRKQFQKAASAVFTYLVNHPKDENAIGSLKFYSSLPEIDLTEIVNYEAKDHIYLYIHGVDAYDKKDWKSAENNMEESLISYIQAEEDCRALCEGPFNQGWFPDLIPAIANHYAFSLNCKTQCSKKLNNLNGEYHEDLLPSHYHYLQYAYFKSGNLKAACQAAASYVLFYPNDDTMRSNIKYFKNLPKVEDNYFTPRPEAVQYVQRLIYEKRLLNYIDSEYNFKDEEEEVKINEVNDKKLINVEEKKMSDKTTKVKDVETKKENPGEKFISRFCKKSRLEKSSNYKSNIELVMDSKDLNGTKRFVSDGLLTKNECETLLDIVQHFSLKGDGYKGNATPHTSMEIFEGITLGRATLLFYFGKLEFKKIYLFLKSTEKAKRFIENHFNVKKELYFTYTHLVCRSAVPGTFPNRTDFSHAIHADNCNILENGLCEKTFPAYIWRDYSAIIYLNDNFQGGDFVFATDIFGKKIQSTVRPKCGRMIAFSAGAENLHGVKPVILGKRCAIALWFTFNKKYIENERSIAYKLMNQLMTQ